MLNKNKTHIKPLTFDFSNLCIDLHCIGDEKQMPNVAHEVKLFRDKIKGIAESDEEHMEKSFLELCDKICSYDILGCPEAQNENGIPYWYFASGSFKRMER